MRAWLERRWYSDAPPPVLLRPLAAIYGAVAARRRERLQAQAVTLDVPVIVVGNISVGGTGKTPFTLWLVQRLRDWGWRPGVIARGYGGRAPQYPFAVDAHSDPMHSGDEPALIAQRSGVAVMVAPDRVAAARALLATQDVNVIVADDGLQHYRLARALEICVVDGPRGFGNGALLPAGPLREPPDRLAQVNLIAVNGGGLRLTQAPCIDFHLRADRAVPLNEGAALALDAFCGRRVHAVAGIGHPARFFDLLRARGMEVQEHAFPDHHAFTAADLAFGDDAPVLMTEKDAIKCRAFAGAVHYAVPVDAQIDAAGEALVRALVQQSCVRAAPP